MTTIAIPSDVLNSMKIPRSDQGQVLKLELALALYQRGILAMGPARRLAYKMGVSRRTGKEKDRAALHCGGAGGGRGLCQISLPPGIPDLA